MNIIETDKLTRRYGRTEAVHALTLTVPVGSVFALLGANGAGKTTTLKLLMNLLEPTAGSARVLGVDSRRLSERERAQIGYVSENQQMPLWMTVDSAARLLPAILSDLGPSAGTHPAGSVRPAAGSQAVAAVAGDVDEGGVRSSARSQVGWNGRQ
jgi:ABC-type Na+ transport system ATPase subunit NatA